MTQSFKDDRMLHSSGMTGSMDSNQCVVLCFTDLVTPTGSSGSAGLRDLYCVLECDRVHKARTVVRTGDLVFDWDETFELDLVDNRELDLLIYSWDPQYRHKLCYKVCKTLTTLKTLWHHITAYFTFPMFVFCNILFSYCKTCIDTS